MYYYEMKDLRLNDLMEYEDKVLILLNQASSFFPIIFIIQKNLSSIIYSNTYFCLYTIS